MTDYEWVALVPMRHESERVPGKNYRPLAGRPLFHYVLETLARVEAIDLIVVDTDSQPVMKGIESGFPHVRLLDRPEHLRAGDVPMNEVLAHDLEQVHSRYYLQTHSTNPLLKAKTIEEAIAVFKANEANCDSLFGVTRLQSRLWSAQGEPLNHDPRELLRTQDLKPVFEENSCLYLFKRDAFLEGENRLTARSMMFEVSASEAWDIDNETDYAVVDCLLRQHQGL